MPAPLHLSLTDYTDASHWRWVLSAANGRFLADHSVRLDPASREYRGFLELADYLDFFQEAYPPEKQLDELGAWVGEQVFGGLRDTLWQHRAQPCQIVQVSVPEQAQELLFRPYELARFGNGQSFREAGIRFIYRREGAALPAAAKPPAQPSLRILTVFSLPVRQNPLNLRRERYGLQCLVRKLNQTKQVAVELRVLQYGATRDLLAETLQEAAGWDLVHLSGHGDKGELLLEDAAGGTDTINADELGDLLCNSAERLKLLILDACHSGASSHAAARVHLGLDKTPLRETGAEGEALAEAARTELPSLAQQLAERLDCAALAMRYPVGDAFATELALCLYGKLLDKQLALPAALQLALAETLKRKIPLPPLSAVTPILIGSRAAELRLIPPPADPAKPDLNRVDLATFFPQEPPRFVGRLQPMLRASQALAPHSPERGVLFHGMPGAGKTACALELAYRHTEHRFTGYVWYQAPEAGREIATALFNLLFEIERQLNNPDLGLTASLADPQRFRQFTLPRLSGLLRRHSLLLVLDNLENLLSDSGSWRDPLWGEVLAALLKHDGPSRLVLTSRRLPADLEKHPGLQREAIHVLSFAESLLLARELPGLNALFADPAGLQLLRQTLRVAQGHPKLLELADGLAADRATLRRQVAAAEAEASRKGEALDAFFAVGLEREGESRRDEAGFLAELRDWTAGVSAQLPPSARLLFHTLSRLEAEDRRREVLDDNWQDILQRLGKDTEPNPLAPREKAGVRASTVAEASQAALAEPGQGLPAALDTLAQAGLIAPEIPADPELSPQQKQALEQALAAHSLSLDEWLAHYRQAHTVYNLHPGVAEAARAAAELAEAVETTLADYHITRHQHGLETELQGGTSLVIDAARRAAPYLLRRQRWAEAADLLENMLLRDESPETLAYALPLLHRIAESTQGSREGLMAAGILANALRLVGQFGEAEAKLRDIMRQASTQGELRWASVAAGQLLDLLRATSRLDEALTLTEEIAAYTRLALPWTQLLNEGQRLQVLVALGRYEEVLEAVEQLRPRLDSLLEQSAVEEAVTPWNVRELLLDTGRSAALRGRHYEKALELNATLLHFKEQRGAAALELARTRYNDYGPLLRLGRHAEVRKLLLDCRSVFEAERSIEGLGKVWSALADLANETGEPADAVRFEETALAYKYQTGQPEICAGSHNNLANYLQRLGQDSASVLAHYLAAAVIGLQTRAGGLSLTLQNLANIPRPPQAPSFESVVAQVERIEGVRFRALCQTLPPTFPDGDAALAYLWQQL